MESFNRLLNKEQNYIIGVSGGCDSMALLDMLHQAGYHLIVCHVNYHLRYDSDLDEKTVSNYCKANQIPCLIREIDPKSYGKENFQLQARILRYRFYHQIGKQYNTNQVILAHHLDDVIETIVMQKRRHNTKGYLGIKEVSEVFKMTVIRPLLAYRKDKLRSYCHDHQVSYRDDYTNFQTEFTRDYVRNVVLKDYNDLKVAKLLQWANSHNRKYLECYQELQKYLKLYHDQGKIDYTIIPETLLDSFIYEIVKELVYPPMISERLIDEIIKQIKSSKPNINMALPVNIRFIKEYNNIRVARNETKKEYCFKYEHLCYDFQEYFYLSGEGHLNEGIYLTEDEFPIEIRTMRPGDVIVTAGGTKKVSRLFIDNKIPRQLRATWPLVVNNRGEIVLISHLAKNIRYLYLKPNLYVVKL
ncbi:MAG: tRNA lysidine(34) synthetase TilS [Thomasclavelia sp.]